MLKANTIKTFFFRMLCGFFLGVSVVAPGVSTSVMAVIMGIYRELIEIISNPFKNFKRNVLYILPMGLGAVLSVLLLIQGFTFLFDNYPTQFSLLFVGLVAGGLPYIFKQANTKRLSVREIAAILLAFAAAATVGFFGRGLAVEAANTSLLYLCLAGLVSGVASMMPGMSVSVVLMLFGVYNHLLKTAAMLFTDMLYVASIAVPVGICFVVGMILFSNVTKRIFERHKSLAYLLVFGFMCGTLITIFPKALPTTAMGWVSSIAALGIGLCISGAFQWLGKKLRVDELKEELESAPAAPGRETAAAVPPDSDNPSEAAAASAMPVAGQDKPDPDDLHSAD